MNRLQIQNFAQIADVDLTFGDLTILVGAQGTGKSLALQWLKVAMDGGFMVNALHDAGHTTEKTETLIDLIFGVGMGKAHTKEKTKVLFDNKEITPGKIQKIGKNHERLFFVPAHRAMLISDGWAAPFQKLNADTPVVARIFSQNLFDRFSVRNAGLLFPLNRVLKKEYREMIDEAIFHNGQIAMVEDLQHKKRLQLSHGNMHLPFMTWTSGQREFTPLLLGLDRLLTSRKKTKDPDIDWVVIEEPEMGLHPRAITVILLLVLDLLWRGYRVVLSTHSPHVVTAVWMIRRLKELNADWSFVCDAFDVSDASQIKSVAEAALTKDYKVYSLSFDGNGDVNSRDISYLDPESEDDDESGWGGLTEFSSRFSDSVMKAVNA